MTSSWKHDWLRKLFASLVVLSLVGAVQWFVLYRTRAPLPRTEFPKELSTIPR